MQNVVRVPKCPATVREQPKILMVLPCTEFGELEVREQ